VIHFILLYSYEFDDESGFVLILNGIKDQCEESDQLRPAILCVGYLDHSGIPGGDDEDILPCSYRRGYWSRAQQFGSRPI
jgi:hypothetical protein